MRGEELLEKMDLVDPAYVAAADQQPRAKKHKWRKYGVVAACLCIALLAALSGMLGSANVFIVKAYALEEQEDGTIGLKEADLLRQPDVWGGYVDGENLYVNVGLRYEGNNIESVTFTTEKGFFAKQYIDNIPAGEDVTRLYVGSNSTLVMVGTQFDVVGNEITLHDETMTDHLLLFWGIPAEDTAAFPPNITIKAVATFLDGRTQEVPISVDLSGIGGIAVSSDAISEEDRQRNNEISAYYDNLPLEKCELIEESVEPVTDIYEAHMGTATSWITLHDGMEFDEDGVWRGGFLRSGGQVYISVIKRDTDGSCTGMVYRVPEELQYP